MDLPDLRRCASGLWGCGDGGGDGVSTSMAAAASLHSNFPSLVAFFCQLKPSFNLFFLSRFSFSQFSFSFLASAATRSLLSGFSFLGFFFLLSYSPSSLLFQFLFLPCQPETPLTLPLSLGSFFSARRLSLFFFVSRQPPQPFSSFAASLAYSLAFSFCFPSRPLLWPSPLLFSLALTLSPTLSSLSVFLSSRQLFFLFF